MATTSLSSDIYGISEFVNTIKQTYCDDADSSTLLLGTFGYLGEILSKMTQNSIVMAAEYSNEGIPTKAKFEKNIIAHALGMGVSSINAVPAQMDVLLTFVEADIITNMTDNVFIFDKENAIYFGDYEFHVDYDIQITRVTLSNSTYSYTAQYIIDYDNPISDVTNPYLTPPAVMKVDGVSVIYTKCTIRQVAKTTIYKKVLTDNSIEAKTFNFTFDSQLADFTIDVTEGTTVTHMVPVYEGLDTSTTTKYPYFYYTYLSSNMIRIKFDSNSYMPRINCDVSINIQTTSGDDGNFTWEEGNYPQFVFDSDTYGYSNLACEVRSIDYESLYGSDKKTVAELKALIPKEALARDSITNQTDIDNYFNSLNTDDAIIQSYKKRDNVLERLYYTFLLLKNDTSVVPTNTITIKVKESDLVSDDSLKKVLQKNKVIEYNPDDEYGTVLSGDISTIDEDDSLYTDEFLYVIPFNFVINSSPLYSLYYLSTMNVNYTLDFTYINSDCIYQYIATYVKWNRKYTEDSNTYTMTVPVSQNISDDVSTVTANEDGTFTTSIRCIMVVYDSDDNPLRWCEAYMSSFDSSSATMKFKFELTTEDYIDTSNQIKVEGLYDIGTTDSSYAYLSANTKAIIHFISIQEEEYGLNGLDDIVPNLDTGGYSLTNSYTILNNLDFFYNYSEIINSTVTVSQDADTGENVYTVKSVPVLKYNYFTDEDTAADLMSELLTKKNYIEYALDVLEDEFGIDFKFFNTYGPSKLFTLDNDSEYINKVNVTLTFNVKLQTNYDSNIISNLKADIAEAINGISEVSDFHASNLCKDLMTTYSESLVYIDFVDMNGYGPAYSHIYNMGQDDNNVIPEFINVNTLSDGTLDIDIVIA